MTEPAVRAPRRRWLFVQATVPPLDVDGLLVSVVGTVSFALAVGLMLVFHAQLDAAGHGWWRGVALAGTGLGLFGVLYCLNRRRRRRTGTWTRG